MVSQQAFNLHGIANELFELLNGITFSFRGSTAGEYDYNGSVISIYCTMATRDTYEVSLRFWCRDALTKEDIQLLQDFCSRFALKAYRGDDRTPAAIAHFSFVTSFVTHGEEFELDLNFAGPGNYTIWLQEIEQGEEE